MIFTLNNKALLTGEYSIKSFNTLIKYPKKILTASSIDKNLAQYYCGMLVSFENYKFNYFIHNLFVTRMD